MKKFERYKLKHKREQEKRLAVVRKCFKTFIVAVINLHLDGSGFACTQNGDLIELEKEKVNGSI